MVAVIEGGRGAVLDKEGMRGSSLSEGSTVLLLPLVAGVVVVEGEEVSGVWCMIVFTWWRSTVVLRYTASPSGCLSLMEDTDLSGVSSFFSSPSIVSSPFLTDIAHGSSFSWLVSVWVDRRTGVAVLLPWGTAADDSSSDTEEDKEGEGEGLHEVDSEEEKEKEPEEAEAPEEEVEPSEEVERRDVPMGSRSSPSGGSARHTRQMAHASIARVSNGKTRAER